MDRDEFFEALKERITDLKFHEFRSECDCTDHECCLHAETNTKICCVDDCPVFEEDTEESDL